MLQALIVEFHIKSQFIEKFAAAIETNAAASVANEPGCRCFDVCRDPQSSETFFLYELYDDEEAIQAHMNSAHFLEFNALSEEWVASKSVRRMVRSHPV